MTFRINTKDILECEICGSTDIFESERWEKRSDFVHARSHVVSVIECRDCGAKKEI